MTFPFPPPAGQQSISREDILALRRAVWQNGLIDRAEAESILALNATIDAPSPEWTDFFVEAIAVWLVDQQEPRGYVGEAESGWLVLRLKRPDGRQTSADLELVVRVLEKATSAPAALRDFALTALERAVVADGRVTAPEASLLRRLVFAPASDRPAGVSRAEADMLFRIKDAARHGDNAPEWKRLFVQGVGNFLQGTGGAEPPPRERELQLERFIASPSSGPQNGVSGFLSRMARVDAGVFAAACSLPRPAHDWEAEMHRAAAIDRGERSWLDVRIEADGEVDEYEAALTAFLAES